MSGANCALTLEHGPDRRVLPGFTPASEIYRTYWHRLRHASERLNGWTNADEDFAIDSNSGFAVPTSLRAGRCRERPAAWSRAQFFLGRAVWFTRCAHRARFRPVDRRVSG